MHAMIEKSPLHTHASRTLSPLGIASAALLFALGALPMNAEASEDCTAAMPGASDYCGSDRCGPCADGEGDCDPGQCGPGLTCAEEGSIDRCRPAECSTTPGASDYCASTQCGPCGEGEGDCDPGQCGPGLTCVEEGAVDHCRAGDDTCSAAPGASDYCASAQCGPCGDGEGDCDAGQCQSGYECVEEGTVDRCRPVTCDAAPGAGDYCSSTQCGPCGDGQGDCDPGQCLAGFECVEEGAVDRCRPTYDTCTSAPDSYEYCAPDECGPCVVGEGDCDPGECAPDLECVEDGTVDRCQQVITGTFQVRQWGVWKNVCCVGGFPQISANACTWKVVDRRMTDMNAGVKMNCPEGNPTNCVCDWEGERMHGINGWEVEASILRPEGGPMYPDHLEQTCVILDGSNRLDTAWPSSSCPYFRLKR